MAADIAASASAEKLSPQKPAANLQPRLWPALILVAVYWLAWGAVTLFAAGTFTQFLTVFWTPMIVAAGLLVWWLFFSKLPWSYRLWGPAWLILGGLAALALADRSMKFGLLMYALPVAMTAAVLTLATVARAATLPSCLLLAAASILSWGYFTLLRVDGITGALAAQRSWRWTQTAEDIFLAQQQKLAAARAARAEPANVAAQAELVATAADWPGFRGHSRDGHVRNVALAGDWSAEPPREIWRRRVGPGWSSFAVVGNRAYTQEQRGEQEAVVCFDVTTGDELWSHEDDARFWEVVAGAGPRATPTFHAGKIYALGGSGKLNCLDAASGSPLWSRDIAAGAGVKPPPWGFSSSPLVVGNGNVGGGASGGQAIGDVVIVFVGCDTETLAKDKQSAQDTKETKPRDGVVAYDSLTGERRWSGGKGTHSYSSPQLHTAVGVDQVLMVSDYGLESLDPATGQLLWEHPWTLQGMFRCCQPLAIDDQVLLGTGMGFGTRLIKIAKSDSAAGGSPWSTTEIWSSLDLKPYFNDFVCHDGHLYGFDGDLVTCVDLATGKRKWKSRGNYGYGQLLLVGDSGLAIILSETGEATLAELTPQKLTSRGKLAALTGKTWNHPVLVANKLLVRNGEEMACFALPAP